MVLDGTFCASAVASLMINGICCAWQIQNDEEQRDVLRKDMRVESELHRLQNRELWEQMHSDSPNRRHCYYREEDERPTSPLSFSSDTEERRRKFVAERRQFWAADTVGVVHPINCNRQWEESTALSSTTSTHSNFSLPADNNRPPKQPKSPPQPLRLPFPPKPIARARDDSNQNNNKSLALDRRHSCRRVRSLPVPVTRDPSTASIGGPSIEVIMAKSATCHRRTLSLNETMMICFMDNAMDAGYSVEYEEDFGSMEDIPLQ